MIEKVLQITAFVLCSCFAAAAQNSVTYKSFDGAADRFSVEVPFELNVRGDADNLSGRKYYGAGLGSWVYIFSEPSKRLDDIKTVKKFVESNGHAFAIGSDSKHPQKLSFKDQYGYWQNLVAFNSNGRTYVLQAVSYGILDPVADRFLASLRFTGEVPAPDYKARVEPIRDDQLTLMPPSSGGGGIGSGTGSATPISVGVGNGAGSGVGSDAQPPAPPNATRGLKLLSKPSPPYTDLARIYEINGSVLARVTFKADGTVGEVSIVRSLPFGLDDAAIKAARQMSFNPALINGKPTSVTKQVEYSFTLY
jgi:TonB family protein